jgi:hypothetical protein
MEPHPENPVHTTNHMRTDHEATYTLNQDEAIATHEFLEALFVIIGFKRYTTIYHHHWKL